MFLAPIIAPLLLANQLIISFRTNLPNEPAVELAMEVIAALKKQAPTPPQIWTRSLKLPRPRHSNWLEIRQQKHAKPLVLSNTRCGRDERWKRVRTTICARGTLTWGSRPTEWWSLSKPRRGDGSRAEASSGRTMAASPSLTGTLTQAGSAAPQVISCLELVVEQVHL